MHTRAWQEECQIPILNLLAVCYVDNPKLIARHGRSFNELFRRSTEGGRRQNDTIVMFYRANAWVTFEQFDLCPGHGAHLAFSLASSYVQNALPLIL